MDAGGSLPAFQVGDGAEAFAGGEQDDELVGVAGLVGLGAGEAGDEAVAVLLELVDGEGRELAAAEGAEEADRE